MRAVKRTYYKDKKFHAEIIYVSTDGSWTTEKPSKKEGYVRRITLNRYNIIDVSEYFPEDRLPIMFEWGYSQGMIPADIRRNKKCSVYHICSRCRTSSSYYKIAKFVADYPNGISHKTIAQHMNHKTRQKKYIFYNSTTMFTILRFVGAIAFDKKTKMWFPGPNSERFLEVIELRSSLLQKENSYGDKA